MSPRTVIFKVLYGSLFTLFVPALFVLWAYFAKGVVPAAVPRSATGGALVAALGFAVMLVGMASLWFRGGGLPMNAFPPPRFVSSGIYSLVPHPIYGGFVIACAGVSLVLGSASGLLLVTPLAAMCCAALVLGYELPDLHKRFGAKLVSPWLPADSDQRPTGLERLRVYTVVLLPWLVLYQAISWLGAAPDAVVSYARFELQFPVVQWTEIIYGSAYPVVALAPLFLRTGRDLRTFVSRGLTAMAIIFPLYLLVPIVAPARPFISTNLAGDLLLFERSFSKGAAAFPSFHVVWAFIAAASLGSRSKRARFAWMCWAVALSVSCITTGMHSIADVVAGMIAYLVIVRVPNMWAAILRFSERIANSWKEWRIGPVRIINHGAYAGAGVVAGMIVMSLFLGRRGEWLMLSVFALGTVGAALWAQWVEGSPALLRPMGFYGGMIGCFLGTLIAVPLGVTQWSAWAALCVAAPVVQALGRLRCLVQGCCHGHPTRNALGICYAHPRSRVCRLTPFANVPVHATPLYSILCNAAVFCVLLRLVSLHVAASTICAAYLILSGIGRFVEEAYRGEPQTKVIAGLRLYQWAALLTMLVGAIVITVPNVAALPAPVFHATSVPLALACGLAAWFVCGVDFPESNRRFARLT